MSRNTEEAHLLHEIILRLDRIIVLLTPQPATIVFTDSEGNTMSSVTLTGTQTVDVAVAVGDINGNILAGDVLDPGATVTVDNPNTATATLSDDQLTLTVTALNTDGTANVTVSGSSGGTALTDFGGPLAVTTTATAVGPATIVLTPGAPA